MEFDQVEEEEAEEEVVKIFPVLREDVNSTNPVFGGDLNVPPEVRDALHELGGLVSTGIEKRPQFHPMGDVLVEMGLSLADGLENPVLQEEPEAIQHVGTLLASTIVYHSVKGQFCHQIPFS